MFSFQCIQFIIYYSWNRPELICVLDVGQHDCITFSGHRELLTTRLQGGRLQAVAFSIHENMDPRGPVINRSTSQIVWQTSNDSQEGSSKITLTSALPLELDSIIQGYCELSGIYDVIIKLTHHLTSSSGRSYSSIFGSSNYKKDW